MNDRMHTSILRRMAGQKPDAAPMTSSRAVRLALTRAADDTLGLALTVSSLGHELVTLDTLLATLDDDLMLVGLRREGLTVGLVAVSQQLRAAVLEMQTIGQLANVAAEDRKPTATDLRLCEPFLQSFLAGLPPAIARTEFDGWLDGIALGGRIEGHRAAGLVLPDRPCRILRLSMDLGIAERSGQLLLALPLAVQPVAAPKPDRSVPEWARQMGAAVAAAPTSLRARLHRMTLPLHQARGLEVGQVIPLPGCTVHSVRLIAPGGQEVGLAKLGQVGGKRALRLSGEQTLYLRDLVTGSASAVREADITSSIDQAGDGTVPLAGSSNPVGKKQAGAAITDGASMKNATLSAMSAPAATKTDD